MISIIKVMYMYLKINCTNELNESVRDTGCKNSVIRGSYMNAHVLLNLLNEFVKKR